MLGLGLHYGPTEAFAMVGTGLVILIVAVYIVMNAACIGFFARSRDHKLQHRVAHDRPGPRHRRVRPRLVRRAPASRSPG